MLEPRRPVGMIRMHVGSSAVEATSAMLRVAFKGQFHASNRASFRDVDFAQTYFAQTYFAQTYFAMTDFAMTIQCNGLTDRTGRTR